MSTKALSLKRDNESTLKHGTSEYHTVDEDESGPVNTIYIDANKYQRSDKSEKVTTEVCGKFDSNMSKFSSESEILVFKAQVQSIFDNYYKNMEDFELFKYKFNQTIEKYKHDSVRQVESFIEDLIEHNICKSDCHLENASSLGLSDESKQLKKEHETTFCSFNNKHFPDSTPDEVSFKSKANSERTFNAFVLSDDQLLETELNSRNLMSENNIRDKIQVDKTPASVQNIRILYEKTIEPPNYEQEEEIDSSEEKYIPIKITRAKEDLKNKPEETDFYKDQEDTFFLFKICSYICKKIRRNPIA